MPFKSCVHWPEGCCPAIGNYSEDTHTTMDQALAVLYLLRQHGFGGEGKFFPIKTEVIKIKENETV